MLSQKYELVSVLGEGSMGEVWLAVNRSLDVSVAIKLLSGRTERISVTDIGGADALGSFEEHLLREAQATAKVSHPSVVRIFDFGVTDRGDPFIVMEYLEGEELRAKLVREGSMSPEMAAQLLLPVMHGMQAAHVLGVVHRDLKPENIFLARSEDELSPKVLDFGIADLGWTKDGLGSTVCGTPDYMAPEQITRDPKPDHRADIWSLAAVLYEIIVGAVPSRGAREDAAWISQDPELRAIIEKGLAESPKARWRSMTELGEALATWLVSRGIEQDCQGVSLRARWLYGREPGTISPAGTPSPSASPKVASLGGAPVNPERPGAIDGVTTTVHLSEFPDAEELGPIVIPKSRVGTWLGLALVVACIGGIGYWARGALLSSEKAPVTDADTRASIVPAATDETAGAPTAAATVSPTGGPAHHGSLASQLAPSPGAVIAIKAPPHTKPAPGPAPGKVGEAKHPVAPTASTTSATSEPAVAIEPPAAPPAPASEPAPAAPPAAGAAVYPNEL